MTSVLDAPEDVFTREVSDLDRLRQVDAELGAEPGHDDEASGDDGRAVSRAAVGLATVSAALSGAGAAWMIGGLFRANEARVVGVAGVLLGCGFVYAGVRFRSVVLQYLVLPTSLLLGAILMSSASGAGTSSLPALVKDAATTSHVLQPPIDFAPGWRLIMLVVLALLTSAACSLAVSMNRPRLSVIVPAPLTMIAALVQPRASAIVTSAVSVGFVAMALATSYAADGIGDTFDARFELRRLGRSALAGVLLIAALIGASKVSFLFPENEQHHVVPPRRPPVNPPQPDVPLYRVKGALPGPLRAGVIDVYDVKARAWMLPPVDNQRLVRLKLPADIPKAPVASGDPVSLTITVKEATGHILPSVGGTRRLHGSETVDYDPRTEGLALPLRPVFTGLRYELSANPRPNGEQLSQVDNNVPSSLRDFVVAPLVPPAVEALLAKAPRGPFARVQSLRAALYEHFIAAGQGKPTDVSADRVVELLNGGTGNPYELTASEALLARWAGVPSRIAYGYHGGTAKDNGEVEFRPADAATYLEVYLGQFGWVPIVGTPPRAQQSLSNNQRNNDSSIQSVPELGINVFLPVKQLRRPPLYAYLRYYLVRALPVVVVVGGLLLLYPVALKRLRRRRRAEWARERGPAGAVAFAYCSLRDQMIDLALPGRGMSPLELVELVDEDEEHAELAWLATRGLWGDLRGQLTDEDAVGAHRLAASVSTRITKAQPETAQLLAAVSRASLRAPYSAELPNIWWQPRLPRLPRLRVRTITRVLRRPSASTALLVVVAALVLSGCSAGSTRKVDPNIPFPTRLAPTSVAGLDVHDEPKAADAYLKGARDSNVIVSEGKVVSFNKGGLVQAALQVAQLKRGIVSADKEIVQAITRSLGRPKQLRAQNDHAVYGVVDGTQRMYLWFPTVKSMALLVVRTEITQGAAEALARALIDYGDGRPISDIALAAAFATTATTTSTTP